MKKFGLMLVVLGVLAAGAASAAPYVKVVQLTKRLNHGSVGGAIDTTANYTLKIASATAVGDTLMPIDISDMASPYQLAGAALTSAFYPLKLSVCMPVNGIADSLYYKYRVSANGTNWTAFSAIAGAASGTTSDLCLYIPFSIDADATGGNAYLTRFIQFIILSDYGAAIPNATAYASYYAER